MGKSAHVAPQRYNLNEQELPQNYITLHLYIFRREWPLCELPKAISFQAVVSLDGHSEQVFHIHSVQK